MKQNRESDDSWHSPVPIRLILVLIGMGDIEVLQPNYSILPFIFTIRWLDQLIDIH